MLLDAQEAGDLLAVACQESRELVQLGGLLDDGFLDTKPIRQGAQDRLAGGCLPKARSLDAVGHERTWTSPLRPMTSRTKSSVL